MAHTKTLAKAANYHAKRSPRAGGVLDLTPARWQDEALRRLAVDQVWGVGWRWANKLKRDGFHTALDLKRADHQAILKKYGIVLARTVAELNGTACLPVQVEPAPSRLIMSSMSFGRAVTEIGELRQAVACYAAHSAARLRREKLAARMLLVFIRTNPYAGDRQYAEQVYVRLPLATFDTGKLISAALKGLDTIYQPGYRYHKAGVMLQELQPQDAIQLNLFARSDIDRHERLMRAHDLINKTHGAGTLRYAAEGFHKGWKARQAFLSQRQPQDMPGAEVPQSGRSRRSTVQFTISAKLVDSF